MPTFIGAVPLANRVAGGGGGTGFGDEGSILVAAGEYLSSLSGGAIGIANQWSISVWAKPVDPTLNEIFSLGNGGDNTDLIRFLYNGSSEFSVATGDDAGNFIKIYRWSTAADFIWQNYIVTWNGTNLILYYNGSSLAPTATTSDGSGTMGDSGRFFGVGVSPGFDQFFAGNLGHVAIWTSVLDAADASAIWNGKHAIDLRSNSGGYDKSADLIHYYRPGFDSQGREDLAGSLDLTDSTTTDSNIVSDAPA